MSSTHASQSRPLDASTRAPSPSNMASSISPAENGAAGFREELGEIKQQVRTGSAAIREGIGSAMAEIKDRTYSIAEEQKGAGVEGIRTIAQAVHSAADGFREGTPGIAGYVDAAASGIDRFSANLERTSVGDLLGAVQHFARTQPVAFFLGAGLFGLLIARLVRSSAEQGALPPLPRPSPSLGEGRQGQDGAASYQAPRQTVLTTTSVPGVV